MTRHWQETWFVTLLILAEAPRKWNVSTKNLHEDVCLLHLHDTAFSFSLLTLPAANPITKFHGIGILSDKISPCLTTPRVIYPV